MIPKLSRARWRRSARSGANGHCVEAAGFRTAAAVRDSKDPHGPALVFTSAEWCVFLAAVKTGRFDLS